MDRLNEEAAFVIRAASLFITFLNLMMRFWSAFARTGSTHKRKGIITLNRF